MVYTHLEARVHQMVCEWPHAELLDLPATGITGNSHMMMDSNHEDVLHLIIAWLDTVQQDVPLTPLLRLSHSR